MDSTCLSLSFHVLDWHALGSFSRDSIEHVLGEEVQRELLWMLRDHHRTHRPARVSFETNAIEVLSSSEEEIMGEEEEGEEEEEEE